MITTVTSNFRNCNAYFRENLKTIESFPVLWTQLQLLIVWGNFYIIKRNVVVVWSLSHALSLCDPMDCSIPGFPVLRYLPEFSQTHVHWVDDAIQPSHPFSPLPAFNLSHHQGLFQWVGSSHQVAKVLELQLQHQFFQWIFRVDFLRDWFDLLPVQGTLKSLLRRKNVQHILKWWFWNNLVHVLGLKEKQDD